MKDEKKLPDVVDAIPTVTSEIGPDREKKKPLNKRLRTKTKLASNEDARSEENSMKKQGAKELNEMGKKKKTDKMSWFDRVTTTSQPDDPKALPWYDAITDAGGDSGTWDSDQEHNEFEENVALFRLLALQKILRKRSCGEIVQKLMENECETLVGNAAALKSRNGISIYLCPAEDSYCNMIAG